MNCDCPLCETLRHDCPRHRSVPPVACLMHGDNEVCDTCVGTPAAVLTVETAVKPPNVYFEQLARFASWKRAKLALG